MKPLEPAKPIKPVKPAKLLNHKTLKLLKPSHAQSNS